MITKSLDQDIQTLGIAGVAIVGGFIGVEGMILGCASNAARPTSRDQESTH